MIAAPLSAVELSRRLGERHSPTDEQLFAIEAPLDPLAVVAGAGTGKTQTMGMRVVWLVANGLVAPHRILGLTFTRKAAAELAERVRRLLRALGRAHARDPFLTEPVAASLRTGEPTVTTYHAYAAALVGEHALRLGLEPSTRVLGEAMTWQYAAEVVAAYDGAMDHIDRQPTTVTADVLALAGELGEHLATPGDVQALTADVVAHLGSLPRAPKQRGPSPPADVRKLLGVLDARLELLPLVERYTALKRARGTMDYGDQVALAARAASEQQAVGEIERARFGAVLLDEYQDTGEAQRVLLVSLFGGGHAVTAVGDPRQSIYGWRGASAGNLERFPDDFPGRSGRRARSCGLTRSFRNGARVLTVANRIAAQIPVRGLVDRPLAAAAEGRRGVGRVSCALHRTHLDEAEWIAERVVEAAGLARSAGGSDSAATAGRPDRAPPAGSPDPDWSRIAILARRRSQLPVVEAALRRRGVPCEVIGLGGMLLEPEVLDVVATLRVLADPTAGAALLRLLTGPRWRIGPRDLDALGRRARVIGPSTASLRRPSEATGSGAVTELSTRPQSLDLLDAQPDVVDDRSLIDALDDLGPPAAYSAAGYRRLCIMRDELRRLRRFTTQPLPDLVAAVTRALGLDVELAARPDLRPADALGDLDRLVEVAEDFTAWGEDPGLAAFLAYLDAADERERGLEPDVAEPDAARVQLLTVHGAKGLEWDVVFVAGMANRVFPVEGRPVPDWTKQLFALPFPLRGDRHDLPSLEWRTAGDEMAAKATTSQFQAACVGRARLEEHRLAYVAVTRARDWLVCSGYWWGEATTAKPYGPSELLLSIREACEAAGRTVGPWAEEPADGSRNPLADLLTTVDWPYDPLGDRRPAVEAAARLVVDARRAASSMSDGGRRGLTANAGGVDKAVFNGTATWTADPLPFDTAGPDMPGPDMPGPDMHSRGDPRIDEWRREADLLLAEHERLGAGPDLTVELPARLSVSQLVTLHRNSHELARQIRRPLPAKPRPLARRGTRFHFWLEQRWGQQRLLDIDELPGAADDSAAPDADLLALQDAFRASIWWDRTPAEVEFPFDMVIEGVVLRGRVDAVFTDDPDGCVDVVDWKTGARPTGAEADAAAVQLAAYRLAWHRILGTPLERVRAAFHYVRSNETVRPVDLLGPDELAALLRSVPLSTAGTGRVVRVGAVRIRGLGDDAVPEIEVHHERAMVGDGERT